MIEKEGKELKVPKRGMNQPYGINIQFDDHEVSQYKKAYPILKEHGMRANLACLGPPPADEGWHFSKEELEEMIYEGGFEVTMHDAMPDQVTEVTDPEAAHYLEDEFLGLLRVRDQGGAPRKRVPTRPRGYVYDRGAVPHSHRMGIISQRFACGFVGSPSQLDAHGTPTRQPLMGNFNLKRDLFRNPNWDDAWPTFKENLPKLKKYRGFAVLQFHYFGDGSADLTVDRFERLVEYIDDAGIPVITLGEALRQVDPAVVSRIPLRPLFLRTHLNVDADAGTIYYNNSGTHDYMYGGSKSVTTTTKGKLGVRMKEYDRITIRVKATQSGTMHLYAANHLGGATNMSGENADKKPSATYEEIDSTSFSADTVETYITDGYIPYLDIGVELDSAGTINFVKVYGEP